MFDPVATVDVDCPTVMFAAGTIRIMLGYAANSKPIFKSISPNLT
jgi:hypothetical protein